MRAIPRFYLSSFLKNQTYFTPILIVFLQAQTLDYTQIFWVFTIGSAVSFLMEIPSGVVADFFGKRRSIILAKLLILISFITFGLADRFILFVAAQSLYELGNSFRTGTEAAYIYDYLEQSKEATYTEVKGKQKFWARTGESLATAAGGVIAAALGFRWVFFLAAIPAVLNLLNVIGWPVIAERHDKRIRLRAALHHAREAVCALCAKRRLGRITINIALFSAALAAMSTFIQPYMQSAGIAIEYFGFVYAASLAVSAVAVRYSFKVEERFGALRTVNVLTLLAIIPAAIIGAGHLSLAGVFLFFIIVIIENIRSPIANALFHSHLASKSRATMGSILSQAKSLAKMGVLPVAGWLADAYSLHTAAIMLAAVLLINALLFAFSRDSGAKSAA